MSLRAPLAGTIRKFISALANNAAPMHLGKCHAKSQGYRREFGKSYASHGWASRSQNKAWYKRTLFFAVL